MRAYSSKIALLKNGRGVYSLDPSIGCSSGMANEIGGCYNDCYAAKSSKLYGYDFSKTVLRDFENEKHRKKILHQINSIPLPFVRMGTSGDPSEDWEHTIKILQGIATCNKEIVIITKHWKNLEQWHLELFRSTNVCVNTSVSALDNHNVLSNGLSQFNRLKPFCKSVLRVVTCDFNTDTEIGKRSDELQKSILLHGDILETVLRVGKNNPLVKSGLIRVSKEDFLGKQVLASKRKKSIYFGTCNNCKQMCGVNVVDAPVINDRKTITTQLNIFSKKLQQKKQAVLKS